MVNVQCPVCRDNKIDLHRVIFSVQHNGEEYPIRKCSRCGTLYTGIEKNTDIDALYTSADYTVQDTRKTVFYRIQKFEYAAVLKKIKSLVAMPGPPSLLDFGAGKGVFLHFAEAYGFTVKGVETASSRAAYARAYFGLDINSELYASGRIFSDVFDALTIFHVLEHIPEPGPLLANLVHDNLKHGGVLVAEVPNVASWQSRWAGKTWLHLDVPRHLTHFTPALMKNLLEDTGCTIRSAEYFSWHMGVIGMAQTILSWFGYRDFLMARLKRNRTLSLLIKLALVLPLAILLEWMAAICSKGGIVRYYAVKSSHNAYNMQS